MLYLYSNLGSKNSSAGRIKCSRGPHLARGPQVPHPCYKQTKRESDAVLNTLVRWNVTLRYRSVGAREPERPLSRQFFTLVDQACYGHGCGVGARNLGSGFTETVCGTSE